MKRSRRVVVGAIAVALIAAVANAGTVLIHEDSLGSVDQQGIAEAEGHTVTVVSSAEWAALTGAEFGAFDAIVIGDADCDDSATASVLADMDANKSTWSPQITGNIVLHNFDPSAHLDPGNQTYELVANGINYVANGPGTGLYLSTGCYDGSLVALSEIGDFALNDSWSPDDITIVNGAHPMMSGLTEDGLSDWGSSTHASFTQFPLSFEVLAIADDDPDSDDEAEPVIIVRDSMIVPSAPQAALVTLLILAVLGGVWSLRRMRFA